MTSDERTTPSLGPGDVIVRSTGPRYTQEVLTAEHRLTADEPAAVGGDGLGPTPYDLLLASLGACKSMTLRMYAKRKGWALEGVEVRLRHSREHARDCETCESSDGVLSRIDVELEIRGDLDEEQRLRLAEISDRCPVHRTLMREADIRTQLLDTAS